MTKTILKRMAATAACLGMMGAALPAMAADLPMEPYVADVPIPTWTGFYVGVHGGYGWAEADAEIPVGPANQPDPEGWLLGAQAGYNWQTGGLIIGVEGDIAASWMDDDDDTFGPETEMEIDQLASIRARLGFDMGQWMPFVTAGWGWAKAERSTFSSDKNWHDGWTVGAGVEYAIDSAWSVKGEYRYYDLGKETYSGAPTEVDLELHTVLVGVNFRF